jgi:hypothetical protein
MIACIDDCSDLNVDLYTSDLDKLLSEGYLDALSHGLRRGRNYFVRCSVLDEEIPAGFSLRGIGATQLGFPWDEYGNSFPRRARSPFDENLSFVGYELILNKERLLRHIEIIDANTVCEECFAWGRGIYFHLPAGHTIDRIHFIYNPGDGDNISLEKNFLHRGSNFRGWKDFIPWLRRNNV